MSRFTIMEATLQGRLSTLCIFTSMWTSSPQLFCPIVILPIRVSPLFYITKCIFSCSSSRSMEKTIFSLNWLFTTWHFTRCLLLTSFLNASLTLRQVERTRTAGWSCVPYKVANFKLDLVCNWLWDYIAEVIYGYLPQHGWFHRQLEGMWRFLLY